ncbi:MAG: ELWxxDGT repeat protein, partial [Thermoanaerobaculia bacterium]
MSIVSVQPGEAQLASLLEDILPLQQPGGSDPDFLGSTSGITYFSARSHTPGSTLWRTDGTPEGTRQIDDFCPDPCSDFFLPIDRETENQPFFLARVHPGNGSSATGLYLARAASPEVVRLVDGDDDGQVLPFIAQSEGAAYLDGRLYFWGTAQGNEQLMRTSSSGTEVEVLRDMTESDGMSGFHRIGSVVLFWNRSPEGPYELWKTDGSSSGTTEIVSLNLELENESVVLDDRLVIFTAISSDGLEVWSTDGTAAHTQPLTTFAASNALVWSLKASSTRAFFFAQDLSSGGELWATDGTVAGTHPVTSFEYDHPFALGSPFDQLAVSGSTAHFLATDGIGGAGLWSATAAGTSATHILDICSEASCLDSAWLENAGSQLFFLKEDGALGREVWTSDGTWAGSHLLADACPGNCSGEGKVLASNEQRLVYAGNRPDAQRRELFVADAPWTEAHSLFESFRGAPELDLYNVGATVLDGQKIYFPANGPGGGPEPWISGGTPASSLQLADIAGPPFSGSNAHAFESMNSTTAFLATDMDFAARMWLSDGTTASTRPVPWIDTLCNQPTTRIHSLNGRFLHLSCNGVIEAVDPATSLATAIVVGDPGEFCTSQDSEVASDQLAVLLGCQSYRKVWRTDGTPAGTSPGFTIPNSYFVGPLESVAGKALVEVGDLASYRLYALNEDLSGLLPLSPEGVGPDGAIEPSNEAVGFFTHADQLWRTDGTLAGTFALETPAREFVHLQAASRSASGYDLLLATGGSSEEVWSTDGTTSGVQTRATVAMYSPPFQELPFTRAGGRLFMVLPSQFEGPGLWVLEDGSSELRRLQSTSYVGLSPFDSTTYGLASVGASVYFSGCDSAHGCELWRSDGTEPGTELVQDISPGPESSNPSSFHTSTSELYLLADDNLHGTEVWVLPLAGGPACRGDERRLCLESGRFQVSAAWRDFSGHFGDATAVPITGDTGYFWFFDEDNVELILKLIDGGGFNGHHWVYYGALSNVEYTFTVTDSETGAAKRYFNPATRFASSGDIE